MLYLDIVNNKQSRILNIITFLAFTILGIYKNEVTVFYIIYLFWMEAFVRQLIELSYIIRRDSKLFSSISVAWPAFFMMIIYVVFIIVLFGFIPFSAGKDSETFLINVKTLMFKNIFFNLSVLVYIIQYILYIYVNGFKEKTIIPFNRNHIILHISIILGAVIQLTPIVSFVKTKELINILSIIPFLILKIILDKGFKSKGESILV